MGYSSEDLINWSFDPQGNFEWVVLRTNTLRKERVEDSDWNMETRWLYYDKRKFHIYRQAKRDGKGVGIELVDSGVHGLAKQNRVPLFRMEIQEGLWLLNKAGLLQMEHFNKSNALSWALTMGLYAMPVVYSDRKWDQIVGEAYYIQLGAGDRFGWTEPEGKVYQIAADNLVRPARRDLPGLLPEPGRRAAVGERRVGAEQAAGFFDHAGSAAIVRRRGEGPDTESIARDRGGAGGRVARGCFGDGRVRYRRFQRRTCGRRNTAEAGDRLADLEAADLQETGAQVSMRRPAGCEGPDCRGDRRGGGRRGLVQGGLWTKDTDMRSVIRERDSGVREVGALESRAGLQGPNWWRSGSGASSSSID